MKYAKILLIYISIIVLNFFGVDFYIGKSGLPGGDVGMVSLLILLTISITSVISLFFVFLLNFKFKINILKAILINQLIYLTTLIIEGMNPFNSKVDFWVIFISFICQFIVIITFSTINLISKK